ncbi:uncharacterized protein KD926_001678 [Aspergillus affinis]|uniref:uncharacterized protein n=1 Tax=Aspergillus affinis TaxID=1070780 RepID=UPI0022FEE364|nr:uncharacterized protein KD926_001678 [Aspergillus affinis]KAI9036541.1 hypothetical protein KD926_001678 [Aspergillus affinis]
MGIPRLTQHLLPFSDTVLLGRGVNTEWEDHENIESIVIDGPSLVYHVFSRLLAWSDSKVNSPDIQPTCNEVSCGVMICLLQLTIVGVQIEEICFDGALPPHKREIRLTRLEKSRRKLEQFCLKTQKGFSCSDAPRSDRVVGPEKIFATRSISTKHNTLPENPFIVPAVFEDLKHRWNRANILNVAKDVMSIPQLYLADFPWADITVMVPGEADAHCAPYGLQSEPHIRLAELIRQTNQVDGQLAESPAFRVFVQEYDLDSIDNASRKTPRDLDARVSELYWQYELQEAFAPCQAPHVYLAILNEDHARRCAWVSGLSFRTLAYSILNSSRPTSERHRFISEFVRRGARIASHPIYLDDAELIDSQMGEIWARMSSFDAALGASTSLPVYWIMFVLYEIHDTEGVLVIWAKNWNGPIYILMRKYWPGSIL